MKISSDPYFTVIMPDDNQHILIDKCYKIDPLSLYFTSCEHIPIGSSYDHLIEISIDDLFKILKQRDFILKNTY